jgi:CBS domain-containing protein
MTTRLVTVEPQETARTGIDRMVEAGVGSVLVCEGPRLVGIFTERDVLRLVREGVDFDTVPLADVMTSRPATVTADDWIHEAAQLMRDRGIRHLPVVEGENVHGVLSIRDVLSFLAERLWQAHDNEARETVHALLKR